MSKVHVLAGGGGSYSLIIHTNTPGGNNTVGTPWKTALLRSGQAGNSAMATGSGVGFITTSESAQILAGDVLEFQAAIPNNPDGSVPTSTQLNTFVDSVISNRFSELQVSLKFYGYTQ